MAKVKIHSELQFEDFINPYKITEIISSKTFMHGKWKSKTKLPDFGRAINKNVFPIDISQFSILTLTIIKPDTFLKAHAHNDEPQFRFIISGSLYLNDVLYEAGEWVIVPIGHTYSIKTIIGYTSLSGYGQSCECGADWD